MTLEILDNTLPQGLHDAQIRSCSRDFETATFTLFVRIVVGLSLGNERRLEYRDGKITFHGVQYVVSEPPSAESTFRDAGCVWFEFSRTPLGTISEDLNASLPSDILKYSLFVLEWHSNIHLAALDVSFVWSDQLAESKIAGGSR